MLEEVKNKQELIEKLEGVSLEAVTLRRSAEKYGSTIGQEIRGIDNWNNKNFNVDYIFDRIVEGYHLYI